MAINRKAFNSGQFAKRVYTRTEHPVYQFLAKNPGQAFTVDEIVKNVKMNPFTVRGMLRELVADELVIHKTPYWAIKHRKK